MRSHVGWLALGAALVAVLVLTSIPLAAASPAAPAQAGGPQAPWVGEDLSKIDCADAIAHGVEMQMNLRAALIRVHCGLEKPGDASALGTTVSDQPANSPYAIGGTDVDVILPDGTYPKVTQSETMVWANGSTIVVNYNDSRTSSGCYSGTSVSTNGGTTFTAGQPFCSGHGTNYGDPTVVWNAAYSKWYATDLATGCGGQGVGAWESVNGTTWTVGACVHNGSSDDRQSFWVDNAPSSPYYGRMYMSWNDFAAGQSLRVVYSSNGGTTWSAPTVVFATFRRDVQLTGSQNGTGLVILAAMDEGGGGLANRVNYIYRSTDGGATFTGVTTGPAFYPPGRGVSGYFAGMYSGGYWRHMGWGQPGVGPGGVVHYAYAMGISGTDPGNVMYVRSTDSGATWSAPIQLNTDTTTRAQWMPSVAVTAQGAVLVTWYDERETASCGSPGANTPCFRRWGRISLDNGATWQANDTVGDAVSPLPNQPDSAIQTLYVGDYDYASTDGNTGYTCWVDGRTLVSGNSQQDVYCDKVSLVVGTPTPTVTGTLSPTPTRTNTATATRTPTATACAPGNTDYIYTTTTSATVVPGTTNIGNACDDCTTAITIPFPYTFYNNASTTSATVSSNGSLQFTSAVSPYTNACLPDATHNNAIFGLWDDLRTDGANEGVFTSVTGSAPNRIFNIEWRAEYYSNAARR